MANALKQDKTSVFERYGLEAVPIEHRTTSFREYAMIQIAFSVNAGNFLVPALAVTQGGLSFFYALCSTILGASLAFLLVSYLGLPGVKYGIPAQYAMRSILGVYGARFIASPIRTTTSLYWFSVQTIGGTYLIKELVERFFLVNIPFLPLALSLATCMAILALIGFQAVKKVTKYFLPILIIGGLLMMYIFITSEDAPKSFSEVITSEGSNQLHSFFFFMSLAFVQYVSGASAVSDMTRYGKSEKHAFFGLLFGNVIGFSITAILGAYAAILVGSVNPYIVAASLTNSLVLILLIFISASFSMISINLGNAYTGGYSLLNCIPSLGRIQSAIVFGIVAITLSGFPGLVSDAKDYISYLGAFVVPLSAIIVTDFIFIKKLILSSADFEKIATNRYHYNRIGFYCIGIGMLIYLTIPEHWSPGLLTFVLISVTYLFLTKRKHCKD